MTSLAFLSAVIGVSLLLVAYMAWELIGALRAERRAADRLHESVRDLMRWEDV